MFKTREKSCYGKNTNNFTILTKNLFNTCFQL